MKTGESEDTILAIDINTITVKDSSSHLLFI